jgi:hypothetical protein
VQESALEEVWSRLYDELEDIDPRDYAYDEEVFERNGFFSKVVAKVTGKKEPASAKAANAEPVPGALVRARPLSDYEKKPTKK